MFVQRLTNFSVHHVFIFYFLKKFFQTKQLFTIYHLFRLLRFTSIFVCEDSKKAIELLTAKETIKFKNLLSKQSKEVPVQDCLVNIFNVLANLMNDDAFAKGSSSSSNPSLVQQEEGANKKVDDEPEGTGVKDDAADGGDQKVAEAPSPPSAPVPAENNNSSSSANVAKPIPIVTKEQLNDEWTTEHQAFNMFIQSFYGYECRLVKLMKLCEQGIVLSFLGELGDLLLKDMAGYRTKDIRGTWELDVKQYSNCYSFTHRRQEQCFVTTDVRCNFFCYCCDLTVFLFVDLPLFLHKKRFAFLTKHDFSHV